MVIQDIEITWKILEGEEEDKYLAKAVEEMIASKNKYNKSKRGAKKGKKNHFEILQLLIIKYFIMMSCHANTEKSYTYELYVLC